MPADLFLQPVLVTGASGFVGKALVRKLTDDGYRVTAVSRHQEAAMHCHCYQVERYDDSVQFMTAHSCIVHLAARVHVMSDKADDPLSAFRAANVDLTLSLARHAAAAGVRRFIFLSSIKVNGEETLPGHAFGADDDCAPHDSYAISKMEAEQGLRKIAAETGMEVVIIRPPLVYGPGVRANFAALMHAVARGLPLPLGRIDNLRSLIALDNLLDFIVACIEHPGAANQTFVVSDGDDLSTPELIRRMARAVRKPARLIPVPLWMLTTGAALLGKQDKLQRLCGNLQIDISKTRELMGWKPPFSVDECLRHTAAAVIASMSKRIFDIALALIAGMILLLPMLATALIVKLTSRGPILYWSERVGRHNCLFKMPKFRSMRVGTPAVATHLLSNPHVYLTPVGRFLRKSSLDELPQLWCILKGDMSFVGPRPALFNQYDLMALRTRYGADGLVPGLTGWAQINGRDELPIPQKVALDVEYLRRRSFWFDLKIIVLTAIKVARHESVSH